MPAQMIEKALAEWREGERVLRDLPRLDPDHEALRLTVIELREAYRDLTEGGSLNPDRREMWRRRIETAHETIVRVQAKLGSDPSR